MHGGLETDGVAVRLKEGEAGVVEVGVEDVSNDTVERAEEGGLVVGRLKEERVLVAEESFHLMSYAEKDHRHDEDSEEAASLVGGREASSNL